MATILEIKTAIATYLQSTVADLTVNGQDLALFAMNMVRRQAEMQHDFEFQRKLLTLDVDSVTGGSLGSAVLYGTATVAALKTLLDVGQLGDFGDFLPVGWTTVAASLNRQREENAFRGLRYPSDGDFTESPGGSRRFTVVNDKIYSFPKTEVSETLAVALEAYVFSADWTVSSNSVSVTGGTGVTAVNTTYYPFGSYGGKRLYISLAQAGTPSALYFIWYSGTAWIINQLPGTAGSNFHTLTSTSESPAGSYTGNGTYTGTAVAVAADADSTSDVWTTKGEQYITWGSVVFLNHRYKHFVFRQEGNLPPPQKLMDDGLNALVDWDIFQFEQARRHG